MVKRQRYGTNRWAKAHAKKRGGGRRGGGSGERARRREGGKGGGEVCRGVPARVVPTHRDCPCHPWPRRGGEGGWPSQAVHSRKQRAPGRGREQRAGESVPGTAPKNFDSSHTPPPRALPNGPWATAHVRRARNRVYTTNVRTFQYLLTMQRRIMRTQLTRWDAVSCDSVSLKDAALAPPPLHGSEAAESRPARLSHASHASMTGVLSPSFSWCGKRRRSGPPMGLMKRVCWR